MEAPYTPPKLSPQEEREQREMVNWHAQKDLHFAQQALERANSNRGREGAIKEIQMFTEMLERNKENSYPKQWVWLGDWPLFQNRRQNMMTKPRTMKQVLLDDVKADPNDPRVARVLEILERKRAGRVPNEQNAEYRKFMGELIEEARAKGKPV